MAQRDTEDREEALQGEQLLLEVVSSSDLRPDQWALRQQLRQLPAELGLIFPWIFGVIQNFSFGPLQGLGWVLWVGLVWPTLGLALAWAPFRRLRLRSWKDALSETLFAGLASLQGVLGALMVGFPVVALWYAFSPGLGALDSFLPLLLLLGVGSQVTSTAAQLLIERELARIPESEIPEGSLVEAARTNFGAPAQAVSLGRLAGRTLGLFGIAFLPMFFFDAGLWGLPVWARVWFATGFGLSFQHGMRGVFYWVLARQLPREFEARRQGVTDTRAFAALETRTPAELGGGALVLFAGSLGLGLVWQAYSAIAALALGGFGAGAWSLALAPKSDAARLRRAAKVTVGVLVWLGLGLWIGEWVQANRRFFSGAWFRSMRSLWPLVYAFGSERILALILKGRAAGLWPRTRKISAALMPASLLVLFGLVHGEFGSWILGVGREWGRILGKISYPAGIFAYLHSLLILYGLEARTALADAEAVPQLEEGEA